MREMNGAANVVNCDDFRIVPHDDNIGWDIFIKMELLTPLTKAIDKQPSDEQVIQIAKDMCSALILCKKYGIIHRDIKPQNIFNTELSTAISSLRIYLCPRTATISLEISALPRP